MQPYSSPLFLLSSSSPFFHVLLLYDLLFSSFILMSCLILHSLSTLIAFCLFFISSSLSYFLSFSLIFTPSLFLQHVDAQISLNELHRHLHLLFSRVANELTEKTTKLERAKLKAMMQRTERNYEIG